MGQKQATGRQREHASIFAHPGGLPQLRVSQRAKLHCDPCPMCGDRDRKGREGGRRQGMGMQKKSKKEKGRKKKRNSCFEWAQILTSLLCNSPLANRKREKWLKNAGQILINNLHGSRYDDFLVGDKDINQKKSSLIFLICTFLLTTCTHYFLVRNLEWPQNKDFRNVLCCI